jgi:hypothetical protein
MKSFEIKSLGRPLMGRFCAVFALLMTLMGSLRGTELVSAQSGGGIDGNSYTDATYQFTVTWPDGAYDATEILGTDGTSFGVNLDTDGSTAAISAAGYATPAACISDRVTQLTKIDGVTKVRKDTTFTLPPLDRETTTIVVAYDYKSSNDAIPGQFLDYFGCEELPINGEPTEGVVLAHNFGDGADTFADSLPAFIDVVNGVTFSGANSSDDGTATSDSDSNTDSDVDTYVDPTYGFTVTWPKDAYDAAPIGDKGNSFGIALNFEDGQAIVGVDSDPDPESCLASNEDFFRKLDGVTKFKVSTSFDDPDLKREATFAFITYDFNTPNQTGLVHTVHYIGCEPMMQDGKPVDGTQLIADFATTAAQFDEMLPAFIDIVNGVVFSGDEGSTGTEDEVGTPDTNGGDSNDGNGLVGDTYTDPTNNWSISVSDTDYFTVENPGADQYVTFQVGKLDGTAKISTGTSRTKCIAEFDDQWSTTDGYAEADDLDLPESPDAERTILIRFHATTVAGDEGDFVGYAECRKLIVDGESVANRYLLIFITVPETEYEDDIAAMETILDSVAFDATPQKDSGTPASGGGIDGNTYASSTGYSLEWDDSVFTAELVDDTLPDAGVFLSSDSAIITIQSFADPTINDCLSAEENVVQGLDGMGTLRAERGTDAFTGDPDGVSSFQQGDLTLTSGDDLPVFVYIECRPLAGEVEGNPLAVVIRVVVAQDSYDDAAPGIQEMLDSIKIGN